jgi:hypothetical protein
MYIKAGTPGVYEPAIAGSKFKLAGNGEKQTG